ncbi:histamine N-methyltransferase-like [Hyperolius riggenbachi]|uniref:histamine N-methyltransferase-like n=1 Tax=Hyperolius riggenbachi TaxID=752182 RepID=UPI0035A39376
MSQMPKDHCEEISGLGAQTTNGGQEHPHYADTHYIKALLYWNETANEHDNTKKFLDTVLPEILPEPATEKSFLNVLGVGSGTGKIDLHILSTIQNLRPDLKIYSETIEPSKEEIDLYKASVSNTPELSNVTFTWHNKGVVEYETDAKHNNTAKKFDLIHMVQMLYYVNPLKESLEFFKSLLSPEGRLVIVVLSGESGWIKMFRRNIYPAKQDFNLDLGSDHITDILDALPMRYEIHDIDSFTDVTGLVEGREGSEWLLDVIMDEAEFAKTASPDLKAQVMADLQDPEFTFRKGGKIWLDTRVKGIVARP